MHYIINLLMQIYEKRGCLPEWFGVVKAGCPRNQYPEEAGENFSGE